MEALFRKLPAKYNPPNYEYRPGHGSILRQVSYFTFFLVLGRDSLKPACRLTPKFLESWSPFQGLRKTGDRETRHVPAVDRQRVS